jgi:predicted GNAT family acetyltransferase
MDAEIQAHIRYAAALWRETERVGPFLATFTESSDNPYLNYAVPDDNAEPTAEEVAALVAAFERRSRKPRLEYLPTVAPAVEGELLAGGFQVEGRPPLMVCTPETARELPAPSGIEVLVPEEDSEFGGVVSVAKEAYDSDLSPPTEREVAGRRRLLAEGGCVVLARDAETREPAGSGICDVARAGVTELAAVAVRPAFRRRGIAGAVTARLAREAFAKGVKVVWLTPDDDQAERIYARAGFVTGSEVLHISR